MGKEGKIITVSWQSMYRKSLLRKKSTSTIKHRITCLKTMFKWLTEEDIMQDNSFLNFDLKIRVLGRLLRNIKVNKLKQIAQSAQACVT